VLCLHDGRKQHLIIHLLDEKFRSYAVHAAGAGEQVAAYLSPDVFKQLYLQQQKQPRIET